MSLILKWQGYREFQVLCKLYSRDPRYSECDSGSQYTKTLNVSGILICYIFTGYNNRIQTRVLNLF